MVKCDNLREDLKRRGGIKNGTFLSILFSHETRQKGFKIGFHLEFPMKSFLV